MIKKYLTNDQKQILDHAVEENKNKLAKKEYKKECLKAMVCPDCGTELVRKESGHPQLIGPWKHCPKCGEYR
jgi:predicted RNA-binding Zn-ribbon protein involved in translation (DUF1610 family)